MASFLWYALKLSLHTVTLFFFFYSWSLWPVYLDFNKEHLSRYSRKPSNYVFDQINGLSRISASLRLSASLEHEIWNKRASSNKHPSSIKRPLVPAKNSNNLAFFSIFIKFEPVGSTSVNFLRCKNILFSYAFRVTNARFIREF